MRVLFTPRAEKQVEHLYDYIAARSGVPRADDYIGRIVAFCQGLTTFPHRGTPRNDLLPGLRIVGFQRRMTIAFTVTDEAVIVEGVFSAGQDVSRAW